MGSPNEPVALWRWQSEPDAVTEAVARGIDRVEPVGGRAGELQHAAAFDQGEWRLLLTRPLTTPDSTNRIQLRTGLTIPVAFFAWDGSNGEEGTEGALSSWYYVFLAEPSPRSVYWAPMLAMALTAGFGWWAAWRAQRRARAGRG
jgi:DMSO reductase family type II enzyme heme b subunit